MEFIFKGLSSQNLMPHGYCLSWNPPLLWTFVISDSLIAIAYFSIPFAIWYFAKKRPDIPHRWLMLAFGLFIIACGITHVLDVINIWNPNYWANAISRVFTAFVSVCTAITLWLIMPVALRAPSAQQLKEINQALEKSYSELEFRVLERTRELSDALAQAQRFKNALDQISAFVYMKDNQGKYVYANSSTLALFKCTLDQLQGTDDSKYFSAQTVAQLKVIDAMVLEHGEDTAKEIETVADDGTKRSYWDVKSPIYDDVNKTKIWGLCGISTDITERKAALDEIHHLAFHDLLTQLPNRLLLIDRLKQILASNIRKDQVGALLFLDLDHFKTINDTLGHDAGDLLLKQVADRLKRCVREGDTVARLSGDEFVVMLEGISESELEVAALAEVVGEKILYNINKPYQLAAHEYHITASIGITIFGAHSQSHEDLLKHADIAMYQAKKAGRNRLRFFDPKMQEAINLRANLESELHKAIEKKQFQLYYQVQVDQLGQPLGAEALIRWLHPERGIISPINFIPLAEETGLILPIGQWVLESACAQLMAWQKNKLTCQLTISVNVSAKQFGWPDFVKQVQAVLEHYAINPMLLKLELTESILLQSIEDTIITMSALRATGIRFSLDDFGTGYSSLQYLKQLPLYQLKIDQSFVRDIDVDSSDQAIVRTIIAITNSLDLNVIAEGVETEAQREFLLNNGCNNYQGYLFGKPMAIEQFELSLTNKAGLV